MLSSLVRYEKALELSEKEFKQVIGVKKEPLKMVEILKLAYANKLKHRGRHTKLSIQDMLFMTLTRLNRNQN
ncbi:MAG: hypothetical protein FWC14_07735 [Candidatus Bathyarchaeota archaeon]|uniref:hypothetical protein n=1 Tax=Candidatus Bathycorpusculum sp. TaxID=2994959 RepID=UPI00281F98EA|nr:hypothetical protein [Candidatus Termiticorpusculum sp.]